MFFLHMFWVGFEKDSRLYVLFECLSTGLLRLYDLCMDGVGS